MKTNVKPNCSNSPKKEFLKTLNIAFVKSDIESVINCISDDVTWHIVGDRTVKGKENFIVAFQQMSHDKTDELSIEKIIIQEKEAAISGNIILETGSKYSFSDFYEFSSAKGNLIKSITSYAIEIKER